MGCVIFAVLNHFQGIRLVRNITRYLLKMQIRQEKKSKKGVVMVDEKIIIKKLEKRIDDFVKLYPDKKGCEQVETIREFIHLLELEAKYQRKE